MIGHLLQVGRTGVFFFFLSHCSVNIVPCNYMVTAVKYVTLADDVFKFSPIPGHIPPETFSLSSIWFESLYLQFLSVEIAARFYYC